MQLPIILEEAPVSSSLEQGSKNDGFIPLCVKYRANFRAAVERQIFVKQFTAPFHRSKDCGPKSDDDKPIDRTLFAINIPPFVTEHHLRYLFESRCGKIVKIFLQQKASLATSTSAYNRIEKCHFDDGDESMEVDEKREDDEGNYSIYRFFGGSPTDSWPSSSSSMIMRYKVAYIVFAKSSGLTNALNMSRRSSNDAGGDCYYLSPNTKEMSTDDERNRFATGLERWQRQYNSTIVTPWKAKKAAENYLAAYSARVEREDAEAKKLAADEANSNDGWITVNRKLRRDRQALVSNQFLDDKIVQKYTERTRKRAADEERFESSVPPSVLESGKRKKNRNKNKFGTGKFDSIDFMHHNQDNI